MHILSKCFIPELQLQLLVFLSKSASKLGKYKHGAINDSKMGQKVNATKTDIVVSFKSLLILTNYVTIIRCYQNQPNAIHMYKCCNMVLAYMNR